MTLLRSEMFLKMLYTIAAVIWQNSATNFVVFLRKTVAWVSWGRSFHIARSRFRTWLHYQDTTIQIVVFLPFCVFWYGKTHYVDLDTLFCTLFYGKMVHL
jgi:hypothetical protein